MMYGYLSNNTIVGFLSLSVNSDELRIDDIIVLPQYQNNGIGSKLLAYAKNIASSINCCKIKLGMVHDNIPLRTWYEKKGFHTVKLKNYDKVNYTVGTMELELC